MPISLAVVKPMPTARERETMVILRWEKPHFDIICTPEVRMEPNIMMVHPPRTAWGREAKKLPTGGSSPARIIQAAPVMMVKRFTTFVMAISPTFCEKDVTGGQPNKVETAEQYPSQAREPEISFPVISRFRPPDTRADVSPMVSAADTRKMMQAEMIAPAWNSGTKGRRDGRAMIPPDMIRLKSTLPRKMAIT